MKSPALRLSQEGFGKYTTDSSDPTLPFDCLIQSDGKSTSGNRGLANRGRPSAFAECHKSSIHI
jgi:hypothetical protein